MLLTYEDVHWIDPTTQELLGLAIERVQRLPVLAIITFRPEFSPPWSGLPHISAVALTRLGRRDGTAMVGQVVGDKALPDEVAAQIVGKTDGVPLFVEELTKAVLESGLLKDAGDRWELSGPLPPLAIPSTLHNSLLARLDRLAPVKEVAQIGAAIGREFSHALLAAVADRPEAELRTALDQLVSSELVFRRGAPPEATYSFKHALVQDAAYGTLLKSHRQHLHARIAKVLEEQFPEQAEPSPNSSPTTAHRRARREAVDYWYRAGQQAMARSAMVEAVATADARPGPAGRSTRWHRAGPQGTRPSNRAGRSAHSYQGLGGARSGDSLRPSPGAVHKRGPDPAAPGRAAWAVRASPALLQQPHRPSDRGGAAAFGGAAAGRPGASCRPPYAGRRLAVQRAVAPAMTHFERALALYDSANRSSQVYLVGPDTRVGCLLFTALILLLQGYSDAALDTQPRGA